MTRNFDPSQARSYFTAKFYQDHMDVDNPGAKKRAELVFQRRDVKVSTVLCLTWHELVQLAGELHQLQEMFRRAPNHEYTTTQPYDYWSRGGIQAKDRQRATFHTGRFKYKVLLVNDIYAINHFHCLADGKT